MLTTEKKLLGGGPYDGLPPDHDDTVAIYCGSVLLPPLNSNTELIFESNKDTGESSCYLIAGDYTLSPVVWARSESDTSRPSLWITEALGTESYTLVPTHVPNTHVAVTQLEGIMCYVAVTLHKRWVLATHLYHSADKKQPVRDVVATLLNIHTHTTVMRGQLGYPHGRPLPMTDNIDDLKKLEDANLPTIEAPSLSPVSK